MVTPNRICLIARGACVALLALAAAGCAPESQLDKANADLAAAQARIKTLEQDDATTHAALDRAQAELAKLQSAGAPGVPHPLPIRTRLFRTRSGYQLLVINDSTASLQLSLTVSAVGRWFTASPIVDPGGEWHLPGLLAGDIVELQGKGFDRQRVTVQ